MKQSKLITEILPIHELLLQLGLKDHLHFDSKIGSETQDSIIVVLPTSCDLSNGDTFEFAYSDELKPEFSLYNVDLADIKVCNTLAEFILVIAQWYDDCFNQDAFEVFTALGYQVSS